MSEQETNKIRTGFYIEKGLLQECDRCLATADARSRNEFVTKALKYYIGYLTSRNIEDYLLQSLSSVLASTVHDSENRMARMDFKIAVELSKLAHVIASSHNLDEEAMKKLHLKCLDEVKRINGTVKFEDAYKYQKREI
ncbi:MAG: hypothetical protein M1551_09780 [Firmicutes bacterium]|nr:hypothetical protein [Bacillota bacterium]